MCSVGLIGRAAFANSALRSANLLPASWHLSQETIASEDLMPNQPFTILGIAGSLRKQSYNRAALRAAQQLAPEGVRIEIFGLE